MQSELKVSVGDSVSRSDCTVEVTSTDMCQRSFMPPKFFYVRYLPLPVLCATFFAQAYRDFYLLLLYRIYLHQVL
jgi:hypothetical protein